VPPPQVFISIILFVDDMVMLASSLNGLQRYIDNLVLFYHLQLLMVNVGKGHDLQWVKEGSFESPFIFQRGGD
jgi:hypothetical protein